MDPQGYDAGKKVTGRKRHILVDTLGLLLSVALDERKQGARAGVEHKGGTVAILNIGRVNCNAQQKTERIDEDVALAAGDLLARVVALRVD